MSSIDLIQAPVTGNEDDVDQHKPEQALSQFYRALNARDLGLMQQNWASSADAAMDNPLGGIKRGWDEIKSVYETLFDSGAKYRFEFHDYTKHETGDLFYVVGRERGELAFSGKPLQLAIRTTRVFRRDEDGQWRQIHHHGSIDDPRMLAAYQSAVMPKADKPVVTQAGA
jgi:ketosteroid isomerase-like protein